MKFRDNLEKAMRIRGMKAAELSRRSGVSKPCISKYLSGAVVAKLSHLKKIADALEVSPEWLFGETSVAEEYKRGYSDGYNEALIEVDEGRLDKVSYEAGYRAALEEIRSMLQTDAEKSVRHQIEERGCL